MADPLKVLILGIGNVLWADEGFGVRAVETLHACYELPPDVTLMDGGTQGIYLLQHVQEVDVLVVFDAVDYGTSAGTLKLVCDAEVPRFMGAKKVSLHQAGFQEALAMAAITGAYPRHLLLVGVQPVELADYGGSLRPTVKARIMPAIAAALDYLVGIWRVQHLDDAGRVRRDTIEVVDVPPVACAAPEDLRDSAERLGEIPETCL
jgi:hydrogenase maturation protease